MKQLIGKLVKVTYFSPAQSGSGRDAYPDVGRAVKLFSKENRILVVNPECLSEEDVSGKSNVFQWGTWVDLSEAKVEALPTQI